MINETLYKLYPKDINSYGYIYKILNLINKKVYIGQTTISPSRRFHCHSQMTKSNRSMPIAHAINKYGKSNFSMEIIAICSNKILLDKFEKICISRYNAQVSEFGYNIAKGGQPSLTEEGKKKIGDFHRGKPKSKEHIEKVRSANVGLKRSQIIKDKNKTLKTTKYGKSLIIFNLVNKTSTEFSSIHEAARINNIPKSAMTRILKDIKYSYSNIKAILKKDFETLDQSLVWNKIEYPSNCIKLKITNKFTKEINIFNNQTEASKFLNVSVTTIQRRLDGATRNTKNLNDFLYERIAS
jgi:group I intron endonuclease